MGQAYGELVLAVRLRTHAGYAPQVRRYFEATRAQLGRDLEIPLDVFDASPLDVYYAVAGIVPRG